jgi:hypothetical protein
VWLWLSLGFLVWLACFSGLNAAGIFDRDEGLYATAARQMLESGNWIVPHIGDAAFLDKPPLIYWLQASCIWLLGPTPLAARLPSSISIALTSLLIYAWAARHQRAGAGRLAALLYAFSPLSMVLARQSLIDATLTLCLTLTIIGWIEGTQGSPRWYFLMAGGAALSTLAKGAIGLVLPLAVLILWLLWRRDFRAFRRIPWTAPLLYLVIALPWHLAMIYLVGPRFLQEYFLSNQLQRFRGQAYGHVQPFWFYGPILLVGLLPWSPIALSAWWRALTAKTETDKSSRSNWTLMLCQWALWAAIFVGFFSLSKSKLPGYALPALPPLCLLAAVRLEELWQKKMPLSSFESGLVSLLLSLLAAVGFVVGIAGWQSASGQVFGRVLPPRAIEPLVLLAPVALSLGLLFIISAVVLLWQRRHSERLVFTMLASNAVLIVLLTHWALPAWNRYNIAPLHDLGRRTLPFLERGERLLIYDLSPKRTSLRYVLGHTRQIIETDQPAALQHALEQGGWVLTMSDTKPLLPAIRVADAGRWTLWKADVPHTLAAPLQ